MLMALWFRGTLKFFVPASHQLSRSSPGINSTIFTIHMEIDIMTVPGVAGVSGVAAVSGVTR